MKKEINNPKEYIAPACETVQIEAEGILCASGSTIDNYNELDYEW